MPQDVTLKCIHINVKDFLIYYFTRIKLRSHHHAQDRQGVADVDPAIAA